MVQDHPIFLESIEFIRSKIAVNNFSKHELIVLERIIHTSGDFEIQKLLEFTQNACEIGIDAIKAGAPILTDTDMAAVAIQSSVKNAYGNRVYSAKQWIDDNSENFPTKTSYGIEKGWIELSKNYFGKLSPIVLFGSSPTALEKLLDIIEGSEKKPSLIIGMPVGFIGVEKCKIRLSKSIYPHIILGSSRGGAAIAAATINALIRLSR